jgi:16S rRNA (adenine1518-N6/adenine1519-N6)-dimethyltransferase
MKIPPKKSLGQNFLHDHGTLNRILKASDLKPTDHVIEVGPGRGILTEALAKQVKSVTAIELDDRLIEGLNEKFADQEHVKIIHQDALKFNPPETDYKLVANIPYYITSPLISRFLKKQPQGRRPQLLTLLVQLEVAQKICAQPGDLSVLAIDVQMFGKPEIIAKVPPSHFSPAPKVDSAILSIIPHESLLADNDITPFFNIIHSGFAHRRKKLIRNLEGIYSRDALVQAFAELGIDENTRAQTLDLKQWNDLYSSLSSKA